MIGTALGLILIVVLAITTAMAWIELGAELPERIGWALVLPILAVALTVATELRVTVEPGALRIRFFPFTTRTIERRAIAGIEARTYRPIREYGGWGLRFSRRGRAYSISGDRGVELTLTDGRKVMIGSRRAEALAAALLRA